MTALTQTRPDFEAIVSGRVDLRDALAKIRKLKPSLAYLSWVYNERKSDDNLPVIEVPEGTILILNIQSGIPSLIIGSGRVLVYAVSQWGNSIKVLGGEVHVTTFGDPHKVTVDLVNAPPATPGVVTTDQPNNRLRVHENYPGAQVPPYGGTVSVPSVEVSPLNIPLAWLAQIDPSEDTSP